MPVFSKGKISEKSIYRECEQIKVEENIRGGTSQRVNILDSCMQGNVWEETTLSTLAMFPLSIVPVVIRLLHK